jgi:hypothetical protein
LGVFYEQYTYFKEKNTNSTLQRFAKRNIIESIIALPFSRTDSLRDMNFYGMPEKAKSSRLPLTIIRYKRRKELNDEPFCGRINVDFIIGGKIMYHRRKNYG